MRQNKRSSGFKNKKIKLKVKIYIYKQVQAHIARDINTKPNDNNDNNNKIEGIEIISIMVLLLFFFSIIMIAHAISSLIFILKRRENVLYACLRKKDTGEKFKPHINRAFLFSSLENIFFIIIIYFFFSCKSPLSFIFDISLTWLDS
jgi:hypothetical protein